MLCLSVVSLTNFFITSASPWDDQPWIAGPDSEPSETKGPRKDREEIGELEQIWREERKATRNFQKKIVKYKKGGGDNQPSACAGPGGEGVSNSNKKIGAGVFATYCACCCFLTQKKKIFYSWGFLGYMRKGTNGRDGKETIKNI